MAEGATRVATRVLVVDDERFFREAICEALEEASIECEAIAGGEEALDLAQEPEIGAVVLDIALSGIGGIEVLRQLGEGRPGLPVIALSAEQEQSLVLDALRLGAFDYLAKPLHDEELVLAVRRAVKSYGIHASWNSLRARLRTLETQLSDLVAERERSTAASVSELEDRVAVAVRELLGASKTSLMLLDDDGNTLRVVATTGRDLSPDEMDPVEVGQGVAGVALEGREPLVVADIDGDGRFANSAADRYRSRSLAVAPLRDGGRPLGVLCATDREDGHSFDAEDLSLLRILAFQIGPLIAGFRNGRGKAVIEAAKYGDLSVGSGSPGESQSGDSSAVQDSSDPDMLLRKRASHASSAGADDAELVRVICETLTTEVEPERLICESLRAVADRIPAAPVSLYLLDPKQGQLILDGQCEGGGAGDREHLPTGTGLTGTVVQTGRLIATDSPERDHRFDPGVDTPESGVIGPMLCLPVRLRDKTLGVMRVFPTDGAHASARTAELLTSAISAAVRNVLMYRSLLEAVDEVARVRCEVQSQEKLS